MQIGMRQEQHDSLFKLNEGWRPREGYSRCMNIFKVHMNQFYKL